MLVKLLVATRKAAGRSASISSLQVKLLAAGQAARCKLSCLLQVKVLAASQAASFKSSSSQNKAARSKSSFSLQVQLQVKLLATSQAARLAA